MEKQTPVRVDEVRVNEIATHMLHEGNAKMADVKGNLVEAASATLILASWALNTMIQQSSPELREHNRMAIQQRIMGLYHSLDGPAEHGRTQ